MSYGYGSVGGGSVGGAVAAGIESGFRMMEGHYDRIRREKSDDREFGLRKAAQERQAALDQRNDAEYQHRVAAELDQETVGNFANTAAKYGGAENVPEDVMRGLRQQADIAGSARTAARDARNKLAFGKTFQENQDVISNLQAGRTRLEDIPDGRFVGALRQSLGQDPSVLLAGENGVSAIGDAENNMRTGVETGNTGMLLKGMSTIFAGEFNRGKGQQSARGGKIIGTEPDSIVPHPADPSKFSLGVRVYYTPDEKTPGPHEVDAQGRPYYVAPITVDRSSRGDAPVKWFDMEGMKTRVAKMGELAELAKHPEIADKIKRGMAAEAPDEGQMFLDEYYARGTAAMPKRIVTSEQVKTNDGVTRLEKDAQGRVVGERFFASGEKQGKITTVERILDRQLESGEIDQDEYNTILKATMSGIRPPGSNGAQTRVPGAGGRGRSPAGEKPPSASETNGAVKGAVQAIAADMGYHQSAVTKEWVDKDGKPLTGDQRAAFDKRVSGAATMIRDAAARKERVGPSDAVARSGQQAKPLPEGMTREMMVRRANEAVRGDPAKGVPGKDPAAVKAMLADYGIQVN